MSDQTKARYAFDLDDLEKQLRQAAGTQPKAASSDPLADLARIVGQDDPFKSMFADKRGAAMPPPVKVEPPAPRRIEPSLDDSFRSPKAASAADATDPAADGAAKPSGRYDVMDEFDRLLQDDLRGTTAPSDNAAGQPAAPKPVVAPHDVDEFRELLMRDQPKLDQAGLNARDLDEISNQIRADEKLPDDIGQPPGAEDYPEPPLEPPADLRSLEPQQPRKGLVIAGLLLGVAALGIGAVVGLRGFSGPMQGGGEAPVIKAEAGPSKVAPQNPGGVEIPNQNKQIYERTPEPKPGEARVVTREEQPVDVQATARAAARVILPGPGAAAPAPAAPAAAPALPAPAPAPSVATAPVAEPPVLAAQPPAAALGEPRRVRTIAVRPDGTIAPPNGAAAAAPPAATPVPAPAQTPARPSQPTVAASSPAPRPPAPRAVAEEPAPRPAPRTQVAAAPAVAPAAAPAPAPAPRATDTASGNGGFMVQLGAPGSEAEARSTFASLQRRFSDQLSGESPVIRRADVGNGRTVYRLRVGPYSREEAAEKCQALQAAGGQCFIARN